MYELNHLALLSASSNCLTLDYGSMHSGWGENFLFFL